MWSARDSRIVADLFCGQEVSEEVKHELGALVGDDNMRGEFMGDTHEQTKINKEQFETLLRSLFGWGMAG